MLSHAVMRVVQVFASFVMLGLSCVFVRDGLPSVEMWIDPGKDDAVVWARLKWWRRFGFHQMTWLVMLESAKDRISGVDPPGQQLPPRVWYGMTCLLIRYAIGCVSCSVEWGWLLSLWHSLWTVSTTWCKRGHFVRETSALQARPLCVGIRSKAWHTHVVGLCNGM
jgi:hypothetical protein